MIYNIKDIELKAITHVITNFIKKKLDKMSL